VDQIASLRKAMPVARENVKDSFDIGLQLVLPSSIASQIGQQRVVVTFRVSLPTLFPNVPPQARLILPRDLIQKRVNVSHPLCDATGNVLNCSDLNRWNQNSSDLGQVISSIVKTFTSRPPKLVVAKDDVTPPAYGGPVKPSQPPPPPKYKEFQFKDMPPVPNMESKLRAMSLEELQALDTNRDKYKDFVDKIDEVKELEKMLTNLKRQTVEFATRNLGYEPQIKELTDDIKKELPIVRDAQERLRLKRIKLKAEAMKYTPRKILEQMTEKADECDRESEDIRSEFMDENMDFFKCKNRKRLAVAYKKAYVNKRKEYHLIQAHIERFKKQQNLASSPSYF